MQLLYLWANQVIKALNWNLIDRPWWAVFQQSYWHTESPEDEEEWWDCRQILAWLAETWTGCLTGLQAEREREREGHWCTAVVWICYLPWGVVSKKDKARKTERSPLKWKAHTGQTHHVSLNVLLLCFLTQTYPQKPLQSPPLCTLSLSSLWRRWLPIDFTSLRTQGHIRSQEVDYTRGDTQLR